MKRTLTAALGVLTLTTVAFADVDLTNKTQAQSYAIGHSIGTNMRMQDLDVTPEGLAEGIKDALTNKSKLDADKIKEILTAFQKEIGEKQKQKMDVLKAKNEKEGTEFQNKNKVKKGVITTESGLQYRFITKGTGKVSPLPTDTVEVQYRGKLIDGTEFDSSYKAGKSATFKLNEVIPGWTEGLGKMKVGDKVELVIPAKLGYGESGAGSLIGPNATLVFEVELIDIKK